MNIKVIKRKDAEDKGLKFFYTGKLCKWNHDSVRYTSFGAKSDRNSCNKFAEAGLCYRCCQVMKKKGTKLLGKTFEQIMDEWLPETEEENTYMLPLLSGNSAMGYQIVGKTLIDKEWYSNASKWLWFVDAKNYVKTSISRENLKRLGIVKGRHYKNKYIQLHRYVMGVSSEVPLVVDHIYGNTLDNRTKNLRLATLEDNAANSKISINNKTGYIGVDFLEKCPENPFRVRLYRRGKFVINEHYPTAEQAAMFYDKVLREKYYSEFNYYNFPLENEKGLYPST